MQGKVIVLSGITGRVGGVLAMTLARDNEVHGIARFARPGQAAEWERLGIRTHACDIGGGDFGAVPRAPDYVVHTAANITAATPGQAMRDNAEASGLLLDHCRGAAAFLHVSTTGVYHQHAHPDHLYREDVDPLGGNLGHYTGSKIAAEGAVRAMARAHRVPLVICRLDVQYGLLGDGAMFGNRMRAMMRGEPILLSNAGAVYHTPVADDDLVRFVEPCLQAASVEPRVVNWCGDEVVRAEDWMGRIGRRLGIEPDFRYVDTVPYRSCAASNDIRRAIAGPCSVRLEDGIDRFVAHWRPRFEAEMGERKEG